jgi:long-chain acyl-CoA synthetase
MTDFRRLLADLLVLDPAAPVIEYRKRWQSWGDLACNKNAIDAVLSGLGLSVGTPIGIVLHNDPVSVAAMLSIIFGGRCQVIFNPMLPPPTLQADIRKTRIPVLMAQREDWIHFGLAEVTKEIGAVGIELTGDSECFARLLPGLESVSGSDHYPESPGIAIDMQTSGTTGTPKRVPLRYESFCAALTSAMAYEKDRRPEDPATLRGGVIISHTSPVHTLGLWGIFTAILGGRRLCLLGKFNVPEWIDAIQRHKIRVASVPPAGLRMILDFNPSKEQLATLVALRSGTAPLDPDVVDEFLRRFNIPVLENYGATEFAGGVAGWTMEDFRQYWGTKRGAVGRLNARVEARVVDPESFQVLPVGSVGLLELQAEQFANGGEWVRTTDLAQLDPDRFLWIKGRADNAIVRGGFKVHPDAVVAALERHPAVREACVVGMPDRRLGQVPVAALTLKTGGKAPSAEELSQFLRQTLTAYHIPVAYKFVDELPRTPSMKISQPGVKEVFGADFQS